MDSAGVNEQPAYDFRRYRIEFLEPQAAFAVVYGLEFVFHVA